MKIQGDWQDFEILHDGTERLVGEGQNLVVSSAAVVLAGLMKQGVGLSWAVGDGNTEDSAAWDAGVANGTIAPVKSNTTLLRELYRKPVPAHATLFVDAQNNVTATPTNRVQITMVLHELELNADPTVSTNLREWGLFFGSFMFNHKMHATFGKSGLSKLKRVLRLTFTI
jgi:hypothetical protein